MRTIRNLLIRLSFLFMALSITLPTMADGIRGNGKVVTKDREVDAFDYIKISGAFTIYLSQDDSYSLRIVADENLHEVIRTKVKGETLYITTEENIYKSKELKLYIGFKHLSAIKANGAITLKSDQNLRFDELNIEINGASTANLKLRAHRVRVDNSGASSIKLEGETEELSIDISGAGSVNALDLKSKIASIDISGVGSGKVYVTDDLKVRISGIGSVKYKGDPKITTRDISFLGTLKPY